MKLIVKTLVSKIDLQYPCASPFNLSILIANLLSIIKTKYRVKHPVIAPYNETIVVLNSG